MISTAQSRRSSGFSWSTLIAPTSSCAWGSCTGRSARPSWRSCITSRDIPEPIRWQAEILLESARDQLAAAESPHRFFGAINIGGRYETNANAGPDSNNIRVFGFEGPFWRTKTRSRTTSPPWAWPICPYWYDFGTQSGDRLETDLLLLGTRYTDVSEVNTFLVEAELGPRVFLGEYIRVADTQFLSLRPFATGGYLALDDDSYRTNYGGGLNARMLLTPEVVMDTTFQALRQDFDNTTKEPTASNQTGYYYTAQPSVIWTGRWSNWSAPRASPSEPSSASTMTACLAAVARTGARTCPIPVPFIPLLWLQVLELLGRVPRGSTARFIQDGTLPD